MIKETTKPKAVEGLKFFEAVKILLAADMLVGNFEVTKLEEDGPNGVGFFKSTWEDENGTRSVNIIVAKWSWSDYILITRHDLKTGKVSSYDVKYDSIIDA